MKKIAHRSGPALYPEQTVFSAQHALENGADMIEIDVRFTKDHKLAVCHDDEAMRIFGVDKNISEMTSQEFLSLRHKRNRAFPSHLLEDYLQNGVAPLLIHVKENEVIPDLLHTLKAYDYLDKATLGVQSADEIPSIKAFSPDLSVLAFMPDPESIEAFAEAGADYIRLWEYWLTDENIARVHKAGKPLWIMTAAKGCDAGITTKENLKQMLALKPDGILINDIGFLITTMQEARQ